MKVASTDYNLTSSSLHPQLLTDPYSPTTSTRKTIASLSPSTCKLSYLPTHTVDNPHPDAYKRQ